MSVSDCTACLALPLPFGTVFAIDIEGAVPVFGAFLPGMAGAGVSFAWALVSALLAGEGESTEMGDAYVIPVAVTGTKEAASGETTMAAGVPPMDPEWRCLGRGGLRSSILSPAFMVAAGNPAPSIPIPALIP